MMILSHLESLHIYIERENSDANSPSRWILQAKIHTYKLYTQSFLSLLMRNGWVSDEVLVHKYSCYMLLCYVAIYPINGGYIHLDN